MCKNLGNVPLNKIFFATNHEFVQPKYQTLPLKKNPSFPSLCGVDRGFFSYQHSVVWAQDRVLRALLYLHFLQL